jgi:DNA-directed RNA polymerase subunit E'/Rpb7
MQARNQDRSNRKIYGVYIQSLLTMKVVLPIVEVGKNMKENLEKIISRRNEGKCIAEGFIRPGSIKVVRYSSGNVMGQYVEFETVFECMICHPVEGMLIECDVKTITKAGIHAEVVDSAGAVPITAFIARDHHFNVQNFSEIKENAKIVVRVIGTRYELNDPYICVIGKLVERKESRGGSHPKLNILDEDVERDAMIHDIYDDDDLHE